MANAENTPWWKSRNLDKEQYSDWQELKTEDGLLYYFNRQTQETTWDKPEELMSEDEKQSASAWVWIPDEKEVYVPARRVAEQGNQITVELESNDERTVNKKEVLPLKKSSLQRIVDDLTLLDEMSVPLILHCLKKRFEQGKIYSAIGTILISINPYTQLDLYTPKMIRKYRNSLEEHREVPPHVFVVADQAYKGLTFEHGPNQSIVISGESGAGKTEATKQCLSYLGAVAGSVAGVEKKVFDANPILEGFGNAKTVRNNNSSRFGKYVEIFMNEHLQLMGGKTQNYLLEKVRVARQGENERNYHIFYMLTKGAERELRTELQLGQPEQYRYCTQGSATTVPGINDKQDFEDVKEAFKGLEFDDKDVHSILRLIAAILHLGNCEFDVVKSDYADDTSKVKNLNELEMAAKLLQVDAKTLEKGITHASLIMPGNKTVEKGLNPDNARDQRDSLCKFVYSKLFDWLVQQINKSMEPKKKPNKSIGILDIFGFEIFNKNSLEQLCINFCNEKLQQLFNFTVFKLEEKVYKSENIGVDHVAFIDNQPILELIEDKPKGIMPSLDEEGKTPGGSEEKWRVKLTQACGGNKYFKNYAKDQKCFVLSHYAGDVVYDTQGFLEKNKDVLDQGLLMLLDTSKESIIKTLFPKAQGNMSAAQRKQTLSGQFRDQLNALMETLRQTEPHYIRCVKPNEDKEPLFFQPRNCFEQLTYSGVFEAVKIRKGGYPFRLKHNEFVERYKCLLEEVNKQCRDGVNGCLDVVNYLNLNQNNIKKGTTMMLYRAEEHRTMELKRNIIMEKRKMNETLKDLINTDVSKVDDADLYYERLARACRACKRYNINTQLSQQANALLMKYIESRIDSSTKQLLEEAINEKNLEKLEQVCAIIEENQYETDRCKLALRMRDRLVRINQECERAVVTLETNHMEACLFAASELEYTNEYLDYFRWMFETLGKDTEKFVQEQIRQAVKMKDVKRRIRLDIKLKDLYFAKMAQMFAIQNCPILKEVDKWAGETILPLGRDKLKLGMMQFTLEDIHTNLTTIPKKDYKKRARDLFSDLQIYMMDKPLPEKNANANNNNNAPNTPDQYGLNILLEGHSTPDLRNEIYCQLIKQLTNNPKPQSVNRGWNMVTLCLYTFAPSPELENYLEVFIRNQPEERRNTCLVALQSIMYTTIQNRKGQQQQQQQDAASQKRPPTLKDMQDILNGTRPLRRDFMETPPDVPSWADLLKSFNEVAEDGEEYFENGQQPLAGAVAPGPKNANNKPVSRVKKHHQSIASPAAPPAAAPPKFQFDAVADAKDEEKNEVKQPPQQQPPKNPIQIKPQQQQQQQQQPPAFNKPQPDQSNKPPAFNGGAAAKGGAIAELQAKLAAKGGALGGGPKPFQKVEEKKVEEKKVEEKKVEEKGPPQKGGAAAAMMMANKAKANANVNVNVNANANKAAAVPKGPPPSSGSQYKWLCHVDPQTGDVFYENINTGATQWERPNEAVKPHWLAHLDPDSGELYFENIDTGETSWDKPDEFSDSDEKWSAKKDPKTGEYLYENLESGQTSKECPAVFQEKIPEQEWVRHFDPNSGEYYYENVRTGVTQWDPPQGVKFD